MFTTRPAISVFAPIHNGKLVLLRAENNLWKLPHSHDQAHSHDVNLAWGLNDFFDSVTVERHTLIMPPIPDFLLGQGIYVCTFIACPIQGVMRTNKIHEVTCISKGNLIPQMIIPDMRILVGAQELQNHLS